MNAQDDRPTALSCLRRLSCSMMEYIASVMIAEQKYRKLSSRSPAKSVQETQPCQNKKNRRESSVSAAVVESKSGSRGTSNGRVGGPVSRSIIRGP